MRKILPLLCIPVFVSLLLSGCAKTASAGIANPRLLQGGITIDNSADRIIIAGHRGYPKKYPENTMISFQKAVQLDIDEIEFDVQLTKDGIPVIMHDDTIDRTTNGTGATTDYTLEELKKLDAGSWKNKKFAGEQIPTLQELLDFVKGYPGLLLNVEIKQKTTDTVDKTMELLKQYQLDGRYVITCFDGEILKYAYDNYGVKCQGFPEEKMTGFDPDPVSGTYSIMYSAGIANKLVTPELVQKFESMGILPWSYTPDDTKTVKAHIAAGIRLMTVNDPIPAIKVLKQMGLR